MGKVLYAVCALDYDQLTLVYLEHRVFASCGEEDHSNGIQFFITRPEQHLQQFIALGVLAGQTVGVILRRWVITSSYGCWGDLDEAGGVDAMYL